MVVHESGVPFCFGTSRWVICSWFLFYANQNYFLLLQVPEEKCVRTKLPARMPQVSTFLSLLLWASDMNLGSSWAGISTRLSPSWLCRDGLSNDSGFVERSTFGRGITELKIKMAIENSQIKILNRKPRIFPFSWHFTDFRLQQSLEWRQFLVNNHQIDFYNNDFLRARKLLLKKLIKMCLGLTQ